MTAHCLPFMRAAGWGRVVNLAGGGVGGPDAAVGVSAYTAAKAAVVMLTETVGLEVTDSGVVVTAIAPGTIDTGFMGVVLAAPSTTTPSTLVEMAHRQNDDPDDIAPFLALLDHILDSDAASLNGRMLSARWENPEALTEMGDTLATRPSRFRLRRIDGALYGELTER
jgi:NAD(P)-dependent dehydrogenase (short-subunit alcohol dehydrogenase family)